MPINPRSPTPGLTRTRRPIRSFTFEWVASSDPDGTIANYAWIFGDGHIVNSGSVASVTHAYAAAGPYTVTLTVTDNLGAKASDTAVITVTNATTGPYRWSKRFGGASSTAASYSTAVDSAGNVVIAGAFWGTVDFGGGPVTSAGSSDIFVAKYSPTGAYIWAKRFGGSLDDVAHVVTVDSSGNVIVAGAFKGTIDFGGGPLTAYWDGSSTQTHDLFVAKYSPTGAHLWSKSFGSYGEDIAYGVAADSSGNVILTGSFVGPVDFGGVALSSTLGSSDIFLAKYSASGQLVWAKMFGDISSDFGYGVAVDSGGNIFMTGAFMGTVDFGTGPLSSSGGLTASDVFVAKYSPAGQNLWAKRFGDTGQDVGYGIATDPSGNVVVTGYFQGSADFGGGAVTSHGLLDTFVAKYSSTGAYIWSYAFGGTNADEGFGVTTDPSGNVFIVGTFQATADFGSGPLTSAGSWDIVAAKYAPDGTPLWSKRFGSTGDDLGYSIATDSSGNATLTGTFQGTVNFGGGALPPSAGPTCSSSTSGHRAAQRVQLPKGLP